jgi:23S rRNA pseudouridine1911/1915/1917 synthase
MERIQHEHIRMMVSEKAPRLDKYLAGKFPGLSRSQLQKLIREGLVLVNGERVMASRRLEPGDEVCIHLRPATESVLIPEQIPIPVLYEDRDLIVVDKPAGLVVHPSPGHAAHTLVNAILARCPDIKSFGDNMRPGIVHRLDRDTSGVMVIAKNPRAHQLLTEQFKARTVLKIYLVLVKGKLTPPQGVIEAPLGRDPANRKRMAVVNSGRSASTVYKVKEYLNGYSLLEVTPHTGRTHQIRVHLAAIGYPVVGDSVYGVKAHLVSRQFVHAHRLGFRLPSTGEYREFVSELSPDLKLAVEALKSSHCRN